MTLAIVNVFPEPVTPRSVTASEPWFSAEQIPSIADGWSPAGLYAELILNFIVPFSKLSPMSESYKGMQYAKNYQALSRSYLAQVPQVIHAAVPFLLASLCLKNFGVTDYLSIFACG